MWSGDETNLFGSNSYLVQSRLTLYATLHARSMHSNNTDHYYSQFGGYPDRRGVSGRPTVQIRHIKGEVDLLSSNSSQVASYNALDIIIMGKAGPYYE